jgi:hypothetical protein
MSNDQFFLSKIPPPPLNLFKNRDNTRMNKTSHQTLRKLIKDKGGSALTTIEIES